MSSETSESVPKSDEAVVVPSPVEPKTSTESLEKIAATKEQISKIEALISKTIDSLYDNPSFITHVSRFWGEFSLWQRAVAGCVIFGNLILIGAIAQIGVLVAFSVVAALGYLGIGWLLEDHYQTGMQSKETLKGVITNLTQVLETTILTLDKVCNQLTTEITCLTDENKKLATTQEALHKTEQKFEDLQKLHAKSISDLETVNTSIGKKNKSLEETVDLLTTTMVGLTQKLKLDEVQQKAFVDKLGEFLTKSGDFIHIVERICPDLVRVSEQLEQNNKRYTELLDQHEKQVTQPSPRSRNGLFDRTRPGTPGTHPVTPEAHVEVPLTLQ